jgi:hypothetical protein
MIDYLHGRKEGLVLFSLARLKLRKLHAQVLSII